MPTPSLFTPSNLMIAASLFGGALFELYPKHENLLLMEQAGNDLKTQFSSPLQAEYARLKVRQNASPDTLLVLAGKLTAQHFWQESNRLLERLPAKLDQGTQQQAAWLLLKNRLDAYYAPPADGKAHEDAAQAVRTQLLALAKHPDWDAQTLTALAQYCVDFGLFPQAAQRYAQLARVDTQQRQAMLAKAATAAGQAGIWGDAERYLREARDDDTRAPGENTYAYAWMEAALKAGKQVEATSYLHLIRPNLPNTPEALKSLATISLTLGEPSVTADIYRKLALTDPAEAQTWNEKAAHWAQTAGLYQDSARYLDKAQALAKHPAELLSLQHRAIDLWIQAKQPLKAAALLKPLLAHPEYAEGLLGSSISIAFLAESQHRDTLAGALWQWALPHATDPTVWKHVARWQEGRHRYAAALAMWERIERQFGQDKQITLMRIQLHWELHQYRSAYQLAQHQRSGLARLADAYQHTILVELTKKFEPRRQDVAMR